MTSTDNTVNLKFFDCWNIPANRIRYSDYCHLLTNAVWHLRSNGYRCNMYSAIQVQILNESVCMVMGPMKKKSGRYCLLSVLFLGVLKKMSTKIAGSIDNEKFNTIVSGVNRDENLYSIFGWGCSICQLHLSRGFGLVWFGLVLWHIVGYLIPNRFLYI